MLYLNRLGLRPTLHCTSMKLNFIDVDLCSYPIVTGDATPTEEDAGLLNLDRTPDEFRRYDNQQWEHPYDDPRQPGDGLYDEDQYRSACYCVVYNLPLMK